MTPPPKKPSSASYEVGYGRPPSHTRFRKGVSGNPGGRPRGLTKARARKLALQEAYRLITVREGDEVRTLPAMQAVMRQLVRLALIGKGPALRMLIELVQAIEREAAAQAENTVGNGGHDSNASDEDRVKALAVFLAKVKHSVQR
jgi:hypothetical protein